MSRSESADVLIASTRVFILSGGAARRAGGMNKSMIEVEGRRIIDHQIERLREVFEREPTIITDRPGDYADYGLETLPDFEEAPPEERFPLRGFARALDAAEGWAFVLAADMPWPEAELIREQAARLVELSGAGTALGLALEHEGRVQPFHAFYHGSLAGSARAALGGEDRSLRGWIRSESTILVRPASAFDLGEDACLSAFRGFNSPPER